MNTTTRLDLQHNETGIEPHCHQQDLWTNHPQLHDDPTPVPPCTLVAAPCGVLLLLAAPYLLHLCRVNATPLGHSLLNVTKTVSMPSILQIDIYCIS